ncbi:hypothetical protein NHH73_21550 [Oxalobacteraceae bacterium OTU3CINTB1]|nr:hypothetical protein NHH73_21550 [Oxalobacteraceae bacterium OTU3CINTB1]
MSQPLRGRAAARRLPGGLLACLLVMATLADAAAAGATDIPAMAPPVLGSFRQPDQRDLAVLRHNGKKNRGEQYDVVVFPEAGSGQPAKVVKTFIDAGPNPPRLSLAKPGSYKPACHAGGQCAPVKISNEAISLCFGEASCEIIYFNRGAFRELVVTD